MNLKQIFLIYFVIINIITFCLYGIDKRKARKGKWRISEMTLLLSAFLGGSLGALSGMYIFHHKTKHWKFKLFVPLFLIINIFVLYLTNYF